MRIIGSDKISFISMMKHGSSTLETLVRDYGQNAAAAGNIGQGGLAELDGTLTKMSVDTDSIRLRARYYRLAPSREVPVSFAMKIFSRSRHAQGFRCSGWYIS